MFAFHLRNFIHTNTTEMSMGPGKTNYLFFSFSTTYIVIANTSIETLPYISLENEGKYLRLCLRFVSLNQSVMINNHDLLYTLDYFGGSNYKQSSGFGNRMLFTDGVVMLLCYQDLCLMLLFSLNLFLMVEGVPY